MDHLEPPNKRVRLGPTATVAAGVDSNTALRFHLLDPTTPVGAQTLLTEAASFHPEFSHQIFEDEQIRGHTAPQIDIHISQANFTALVGFQSSAKGSEADDVVTLLKNRFPAGICESREEYKAQLEAAGPLNEAELGTPLSTSTLPSGGELLVYCHNLASSNQTIKELHNRIQPLLLFFIDGASFIDASDSAWDVLLAVQRRDGVSAVVGYCSMYSFWAYPDRTRLRLSQILILPPHQRKGIGGALLSAVYMVADQRDVLDVTFEDPVESLQRLRDRLDLQRALRLPWLVAQAAQAAGKLAEAATPNGASALAATTQPATNGIGGSSAAAVLEPAKSTLVQMRQALRVCKPQAHRIWEALIAQQAQLQGARGRAALRALVQKRLATSLTTPGKLAEHKRFVDSTDTDGFVMLKCAPGCQIGAPVPMDVEEGEAAEDQQQDLEEAVEARIAELLAVSSH